MSLRIFKNKMVSFLTAIIWIKEGKKVKRNKCGWYMILEEDNIKFKDVKDHHYWEEPLCLADVESESWEVYEEGIGEVLRRLGTDGELWTKEFMKRHGNKKEEIDFGLMMSWFCNAIEAGRSAK